MLHLSQLVITAKEEIKNAQDINTLELIRIKYLGKKSHLSIESRSLRNINPENRSIIGASINLSKKKIKKYLNARYNILKTIMINQRLNIETIDISLPGRRIKNGGLHPITRTINRISKFFYKLGFSTALGPEIEDDYHNFDALNISQSHPARDDHDTFWFDSTRLLRTQTSSVQIHTMNNQHPPICIITPGRVYRNDYDQTHTPMFHQMEGLLVDKNISFSNLKGILCNFLYDFFEKNIKIRFRPSYFPFTEPSAEIDIINKNDKWLEVLGCGMVHPNVLHNVGINPETYCGFAFGIGIERLTMLRYGITDVRIFFENDLRFLEQLK
ncbi:Phenylalanine--tRNA ligase alpha subunit [Candidatus Ecksteinia adelgidicola]|nr:Phenylalanine--tRNA ligase alpha subunit [Candidatus Ecksteinia adelgidicola]